MQRKELLKDLKNLMLSLAAFEEAIEWLRGWVLGAPKRADVSRLLTSLGTAKESRKEGKCAMASQCPTLP